MSHPFGVREVSNLPPWAYELPEILPHGSGIDSDWVIEGHAHHITCRNSFHCMSEDGIYEGWQDFSIILKKGIAKTKNGQEVYTDANVHFHGNQYLAQKHMLREYLGDTFASELSDFIWGSGLIKTIRGKDAWLLDHWLKMAQNEIQPHCAATLDFQERSKNLNRAMELIGHVRSRIKPLDGVLHD